MLQGLSKERVSFIRTYKKLEKNFQTAYETLVKGQETRKQKEQQMKSDRMRANGKSLSKWFT